MHIKDAISSKEKKTVLIVFFLFLFLIKILKIYLIKTKVSMKANVCCFQKIQITKYY